VFDPLAVMLVVAFNQALLLREENGEDFAKRKATGKTSASKSWWKFWEMYGEEKEKTQDDHWKEIYSQDTLIDDEVEGTQEEVLTIEEDKKLPRKDLTPTARGGIKN
jgi:hypothetical protein